MLDHLNRPVHDAAGGGYDPLGCKGPDEAAPRNLHTQLLMRGLEKSFSESTIVTVPLAGDPYDEAPCTGRSAASNPAAGGTPRQPLDDAPPRAPTALTLLCSLPIRAWLFLAARLLGRSPAAAPAGPQASPLRPGEPSPCLLLGQRAPPPKPLFSSALSLWGGSDYQPRAGVAAGGATAAPSVEASPARSVLGSGLTPGAAWAAWPGGVAGMVEDPPALDDSPKGDDKENAQPRSFYRAKPV